MNIFLPFVVIIFTLVQSLFGIGILVFGTPVLLLLGFPFTAALLYLLPCSLVVSFLQVREQATDPLLRRSFIRLLLPGTLPGLVLVLVYAPQLPLRGLIGGLLLLTALSRASVGAQAFLRGFARRCASPYLLLTGFIHGLTNLGGGLLTVFCTARFSGKNDIRSGIAAGYLLMAGCQLAVLFPFAAAQLGPLHLLLPLLAGLTYAGPGRLLFRRTGSIAYDRLFTTLMTAMGLVLLAA